jgi:hypothetical protein
MRDTAAVPCHQATPRPETRRRSEAWWKDNRRLPFSSMPLPVRPPGVSYDGRSSSSVYWGKSTIKVKMCPHVRIGGGQCGLEARYCMCMCLLCGKPMEARKKCRRKQDDGSICPWGEDRSPDVSSPEQDRVVAPAPLRRRRVTDTTVVQINYMDRSVLPEHSSADTSAATERPTLASVAELRKGIPTTWTRTESSVAKRARGASHPNE